MENQRQASSYVPIDQGYFYVDSSRLRTVLIYEALGTAFVTVAFTLSMQIDMIRAFAYFAAFLFAWHITGAHFNPATTLACFLYDKLSGKHSNIIDE